MKKLTLILLILLTAFLVACSAEELPQDTPQPTQDINAIYTQAAKTLFAEMTSKAPTSTPEPTKTPGPTSTPEPTKTPWPTKTPILTGEWKTEFDRSSFDDSQTIILALKANYPITGWLDNTYTPVLVVRCRERVTEVAIIVGMSPDVEYGLYNKSTVRVRFDSRQAETIIASESTNGESLFFPDAQYLISRMLQSERMVFGFTPYNANPVETSFDLYGLNEAIKPLQEACR